MDKKSVNNIAVSICIANFNGEEYISECIDSVINQDTTLSYEIIVHDDASEDHSVHLIEKKYPQVKLLKSKKNVGYCISNNNMVEAARGKFLLLLNNDAQLLPDALDALFLLASKYENALLGLTQYNSESKELIDRGSTFDIFLNPIPNQDTTKNQVAMIMGACLWIPKTIWEKIGGFPTWFDSLAEDMYICTVARLMGYPVIVSDKSGFNHYVGKSLGGGKVTANKLSTTYKRRRLSERNKTYVMYICYPLPLLIMIFPIHITLLYLEGMLLTIIKHDTNIWKFIYKDLLKSLLLNRKTLVNARKNIQNQRTITANEFLRVFTWSHYKFTMLKKYGLPKLN